MSNTSRQSVYISVIVSLGGFLFGFDASVISGVIRFIKPEFALDDLALGWVVSAPSFAAMFSMMTAGTISDRIGRKRLLIIIALLYALSAFLSPFAVSYYMLVVARMIGGLAFGAALILVPMYIAEIAPSHIRGKLVSIQQLNIVLGFSAAYFSNYYLLQLSNSFQVIVRDDIWRWMLGVEIIPAFIYLLALFLIPRSPRWLFMHGFADEARDLLIRLHGKTLAMVESRDIKESLSKENNGDGVRWTQLFKGGMKVVMTLGLVVGVLQQITGVNAIYFYATIIFEQTGIGTDASFAQAIWVGVINVLFTILAMLLIDRLGRRPLLLIGIAGVAISMMVTSYGFYQSTYTLTEKKLAEIETLDRQPLVPLLNVTYSDDVAFKDDLKDALGFQTYSNFESELIASSIEMNPYIILIGILGFVASFAFSLGPVVWVLLSELFPNRLRGLAVSIIGFTNSLVSWLVQFWFPWELSNFGNVTTYLIYAFFAIIGFVVLYRSLPETKGKSLEELEQDLGTNLL